ncbi:MAG: hypothetical protein NTY53_06020 [Kiritimatiellaeota bacterium]|nr:hypothetical protein [Kiritimatiellota bacterium]
MLKNNCRADSRLSPPLSCLRIFAAAVATGCVITSAHGWGGEHSRITAVAVEALPPVQRAVIAPEAAVMARVYCGFPDVNWACYGEWGGGNADPSLPRLPDLRREWDVSFYCGSDPVLQKGKHYPHQAPQSLEAVAVHFEKTVEALQAGRLADGARFAGVMFHYIQDSGSFPHLMPIHRAFHVRNSDAIRIAGYEPQQLGNTPAEAAAALTARVRKLVDWTEQRLAPLLAEAGVLLDEAKRLVAKDPLPAAVAQAVAKLRAEKPADYEAAALACANECARVCTDALHTALAFAPRPWPPSAENRPDKNLVFNPSFETGDGDRVPEGWYIGWLDLNDRTGRAEWYRAGIHWDKPVRTGQHSALLLWTPPAGLEWRQTWRRAVPVNAGETYRAAVWVKARAATGATWLALQFSDTAYEPVSVAKSEVVKTDCDWKKLSLETVVPPNACWLRAILHTAANSGAVWFDDVEIMRTRSLK